MLLTKYRSPWGINLTRLGHLLLGSGSMISVTLVFTMSNTNAMFGYRRETQLINRGSMFHRDGAACK
jgi:hypothetical protein